MKKFEVVKIFFIALITGNIMGIVLIQIFHNLTIKNVIIMEVVLILIIIMLFLSIKLWNKRQNRKKNQNIL
jgi:high-affinity Fe2+/Pb2+ permease